MRKSCPFTQNNHTLVLCAIFSREDKIFIVEKWYETRSLAFTRRAFRQRDLRYHGKNLPSQTSIERVVKHFQRTGTVTYLKNTYLAPRGRDFSPEKVRRVKKVYAQDRRFLFAELHTQLMLHGILLRRF